MVDVPAAQARLHVGDGNLAVVGGERTGHRGSGVALDYHPVRLLRIEHFADTGEQGRGQSVERLVRLHKVEVVVGHDARDLKHLVEHAAVLPGHAHAAVEPGVRPQRMDQREELDGFGAGAEDGEDLTRVHPRSR